MRRDAGDIDAAPAKRLRNRTRWRRLYLTVAGSPYLGSWLDETVEGGTFGIGFKCCRAANVSGVVASYGIYMLQALQASHLKRHAESSVHTGLPIKRSGLVSSTNSSASFCFLWVTEIQRLASSIHCREVQGKAWADTQLGQDPSCMCHPRGTIDLDNYSVDALGSCLVKVFFWQRESFRSVPQGKYLLGDLALDLLK